ncbi:hypothetical protein P280DRAFT_487044 [Massarina eburnea CBS 473.64]|uniref:Uncharacterized protein n=1 Tax=Massarina eburnea CBS 473.64 TaxID=1395130 RepID=A0A6A6S9K9_9PLEO|nr:hypothetical protein P280DRAFT_487044 [Massarina eburnea CBS 473.64]
MCLETRVRVTLRGDNRLPLKSAPEHVRNETRAPEHLDCIIARHGTALRLHPRLPTPIHAYPRLRCRIHRNRRTTTTADDDCHHHRLRHSSSRGHCFPELAHSPESLLHASPDALGGADTGLPPTPPSNSLDAIPEADFGPPPHADGVVSSLLPRTSTKSPLGTPVNQRSPPTPDPSPPRTTESMSKPMSKPMPTPTPTPIPTPTPTPQRPALCTYPSSRTDSFRTAREEPVTADEDSGSSTPTERRPGAVDEALGLGLGLALAFEREDNNRTPRNTVVPGRPDGEARGSGSRSANEDRKDAPDVEDIPDREWDGNLMRNVTVRRKRRPRPFQPSPSASPKKKLDSPPASPSPSPSPAAGSTPRRRTSLRKRIEASRNSPTTPAIEQFAKQIGWPAEGEDTAVETSTDAEPKRFSTSSMSSTVVEAMVIVTPPQNRRTLRHSGKNLAYVRHASAPMESPSRNYSSRTSQRSEDVPLHRLVHKRVIISERPHRLSTDTTSFTDRSASALSISKQRQDSAAATLAHQESVRCVLQPAAEIMSRSNLARNAPAKNYHRRMSSAPEPGLRRNTASPDLRASLGASPSKKTHPRQQRNAPSRLIHIEAASPTSTHFEEVSSPESPLQTSPAAQRLRRPRSLVNINKSLPAIPTPTETPVQPTDAFDQSHNDHENPPPRRGSSSARGRSEERQRSSHSQDRASTSRDALRRPSLDRQPTEEVPRTSHEWHSFHTDEHRRISFDRPTSKTEEHAMARHLYAQTTPFSQFSDTPIEVSEATAVSIYPHNNHSLLVVQQLSRTSTQAPLLEGAQFASTQEGIPPTPPFVDAVERPEDKAEQPTITFEPSTPPMHIQLPAPGTVDSPLRNPRPPPEPPIIKFIPPTPAEELERQLPPGPPKHSDSYPQRRLSLKQRARRYSDNLITPLLARATGIRGRRMSESHARGHPQVPTVNDSDNALHPFWRPRGFWDGFDDSDSDSNDDLLPRGGDTSDVEESDSEPESPRKLGQLGRKLTSGWRNSGGPGFLIGNSLGVERAGTNKRRPQISLTAGSQSFRRLARKTSAPRILVQPPTLPLRSHNQRIEKRGSRNSLRSSGSFERRSRHDTWRNGKKIPGFKGVQVQYIGLSGVRERIRERKAEKRREELRKSIGGRWYVEPVTPGSGVV